MTKPVVHLFGIRGDFALVIPYKSGVIYTNQTGGVCCNHPELEGLVYPVDYALPGLPELLTDATGLSLGEADACDAVFDALHGEINIRVDRTRLDESEEAWLWVIVHELEMFSVAGIPYPFSAVLTWENSD